MLQSRAEESPAAQYATLPIHQQLEDRLATLSGEYDKGQTGIRRLEAELASLRETMLRISGAILVLQEILSSQTSGPLENHHRHESPTATNGTQVLADEDRQTAIRKED